MALQYHENLMNSLCIAEFHSGSFDKKLGDFHRIRPFNVTCECSKSWICSRTSGNWMRSSQTVEVHNHFPDTVFTQSLPKVGLTPHMQAVQEAHFTDTLTMISDHTSHVTGLAISQFFHFDAWYLFIIYEVYTVTHSSANSSFVVRIPYMHFFTTNNK